MPVSVLSESDVNVLSPSDISTSASDYQVAGTATPGVTGRVADAGHVHPAQSIPGINIQVVSVNVEATVTASNGDYTASSNSVTVTAPSGYQVIGGGYSLVSDIFPVGVVPEVIVSAPSADGSEWEFEANLTSAQVTYSGAPIGTVYAICLGV